MLFQTFIGQQYNDIDKQSYEQGTYRRGAAGYQADDPALLQAERGA